MASVMEKLDFQFYLISMSSGSATILNSVGLEYKKASLSTFFKDWYHKVTFSDNNQRYVKKPASKDN